MFGAGKSGRAAEALGRALGWSVRVLDGGDALPDGAFDLAVVSPGIALSHPWIAGARCRGIPLVSELQLGCEQLRAQGVRMLAVTGSKGKSSVVKVVADAISLSGRRAVPCGNYGKPVCEVALEGGCDWAVVEVSSFMMETTELPPGTFESAAILNLQEDHLDRHGSVAVYHGLKRRLLAMAREGGAIDNSRPADRRAIAPAGAGERDDCLAGSYFDNEILRANGLAARSLMKAAGLDDATVARAFREFVPLPHRMNLVAELDGVRYVDDSKATSLAALAAGVRMAWRGPSGFRRLAAKFGFPWRRRVLLIAGGLPKGDDPKTVLPILTERVKKVYLIGQSAEAFSAVWGDAVDCEICGTMDRAVGMAKRDAAKGETVLLSPGTASFDQFQSYGERGEVFARLVQKEGQQR